MKENLFDHLPIHPIQIHIPNGNSTNLVDECLSYDELINREPFDLQILGIGRNGHIGFNEPGTSFESRTHIVQLAESTRLANSTFFSSLEDVPTQAITMGIQSILQAKRIILLISGASKSPALKQFLTGVVSEDFPASILHRHPDVTLIIDEEAWTNR
jgi:glucosamine-6-phosphate deaminase